MKKTDKLQPRRKLVLSRETVKGLSRELDEQQLRRVLGGTCYTDVRISQCCPDA
jgi:hypothetical protein